MAKPNESEMAFGGSLASVEDAKRRRRRAPEEEKEVYKRGEVEVEKGIHDDEENYEMEPKRGQAAKFADADRRVRQKEKRVRGAVCVLSLSEKDTLLYRYIYRVRRVRAKATKRVEIPCT